MVVTNQPLSITNYFLHFFALGFYFAITFLFTLSSLTYSSTKLSAPTTSTVIDQWQAPPPAVYRPSPALSLVPPAAAAAARKQPFSLNPFAGLQLYLSTNHALTDQAAAWRQDRPADAALLDKIAAQPAATWLGGWITDIKSTANDIIAAAAAKNSLPVLVAYNLPNRDCGGYSAGGAASAASYKAWIQSLAAGIGPRQAVVILEPDSLGVIDCLQPTELAARYALLTFAVQTLQSLPHTYVYLDAGHSNWLPPVEIAARLKKAGLAQATGFATNVSNFYANDQENRYASAVSRLVGGKHYVIDTSRNGLGSNGQWCNPDGRALGTKPQTGSGLLDAYLWIKTPGESDGTCNSGPPAGTFWPNYALDLATRAGY